MRHIKSFIKEVYTKEHTITPLILPPSIIICVSAQINTIINKSFPSPPREIAFNRFTHHKDKMFLTTDNSDFINWYSSIQASFPPSIANEFLIAHSGFFIAEQNTGQPEITLHNNDWRIATYLVTYNVENERVVSFYREKLEEKHLK